MQRKKLQVFVSSTYTDLPQERQAAVEAILTAGHIPAGMELFSAGDESQLEVIRRWIEESDVYLLILGGRYGSLEPTTGKSYIHLEYEHAIATGKPLFAVVITPDALEAKVKLAGTAAVETENPQKFKQFRSDVLARMVRFWSDPRDIKLAILETLAEHSRRDDLPGWVRATQEVNAAALAEEISRLARENNALRERLASTTPPTLEATTYEGLVFEEFYRLLATTPAASVSDEIDKRVKKVAQIFGDSAVGLLHVFWVYSEKIRGRITVEENTTLLTSMLKLKDYGVLRYSGGAIGAAGRPGVQYFDLTEVGHQFLLRLRVKRDSQSADECLLPKNRNQRA